MSVGISAPQPLSRDSLAWRRGLLGEQRWTLDELAAELRRHHRGVILILSRETAAREVMLAAPQYFDAPLQVLDRAAAQLGIAYRPLLDGRLVLLGEFPLGE